MRQDDFGDRMKVYEAAETERKFTPLLPVYARLDGRSFSKFTSKFQKPYDPDIAFAMRNTLLYLVEHTHAVCGYTQSDEISLVWYSDEYDSKIFFDGKIHKMTSVLASLATGKFFNDIKGSDALSAGSGIPAFDCRVLQMPNLIEAANMILWRAMDCKKNAITSGARKFFSHKELHAKNGVEMREMMLSKGVCFERDFPADFVYGVFALRESVEVQPGVYRRKAYTKVVPDFQTVVNREEVLFHQGHPVRRSDITVENCTIENCTFTREPV